MSISLKVRKIMVHIFWSLFGAGVVVLLAAAVRAKQDKTCAGLVIEFSGEGAPLFLTKGEVASLLTSHGKKPLKGKVLRAFDLQQLEEKVEQKIYVEDAEIFFNNQQVLHVKVSERIPVVRVFTSQGNGFFLDTGGRKLPLQHNAAIRLPVFTGYPYEGQQVTREERPLIKDMIRIGQGLQADPFLMALISTVDYVGKGQFELLPVIGHQVIEWGDGTDTEKKCNRLRQFYQSVISVYGLDYYERIKVQFVGQVIGVRNEEKEKLLDEVAASKQIKEVIAKLQSEQQSQAEQAVLDIIEEAIQQEKTSSTKKTSEELKRY